MARCRRRVRRCRGAHVRREPGEPAAARHAGAVRRGRGAVPPFDPQRLNKAGSVYLTRPSLGHFVAKREELLERAADVYGWVASGDVKVHVGHRYDLAEVYAAHADLEARRSTGKLLLIP